MIKTIVVPVDGSDHAKKAAGLAADIAEKYGARLVFIHSLMRNTTAGEIKALSDTIKIPDTLRAELDKLQEDAIEAVASAYDAAPISIPMPDKILREVAEVILDDAKATAQVKGVSDVDAKILDGSPTDAIVAAAKGENADMVVMGSRGLSNIGGLLMGSVSHKVSHLCDCTCVTVK